MAQTTVLILNEQAKWYAQMLAKAEPRYAYRAVTSVDEPMAHAADATVLIGIAPQLPAQLIGAMDGLAWVQALTTGIDNLLQMPELPQGTAITNCQGIHGPQMAELAMLLMMSCARRFPQMLANQKDKIWDRWPQALLLDKSVCIVGLGTIAETLATYCATFGMHVTGVSDGRTEVPGFARIWRRADLSHAAAQCDFLVVLVPLSAKTRHIVDATVLGAMQRSAFLINIARGGCVDEEALLAAMRAGQIAGAALDVFAAEPLPPQSPLYDEPNVIITPHVGGYADIYHEQALPILAANLTAYADGGIHALPGVTLK